VKKIIILVAACVLTVSTALAARSGQEIYLEHCAGCHGKDGSKPAGGLAPLAGESTDAIFVKLRGYADGVHGGKLKNVMQNVTRKIDGSDMRAVSDFIDRSLKGAPKAR
jgi:cytochrome c